MKNSRIIYVMMMFAAIIFIGCEKLEVPVSESPDTEQDDSSNTDDKNEDSDDTQDDSQSDVDESDEEDGVDGDDETEDEPSNDGSAEYPFTASDLLNAEIYSYIVEDEMIVENIWVQGYIVGYVKGTRMSANSTIFSVGGVETNVIIADSPEEKDYSNCIPIQLSTGNSYIGVRSALNLSDNPENLGKKVSVLGMLRKYFSTVGLKNTRKYKIIE